jgi:transposase
LPRAPTKLPRAPTKGPIAADCTFGRRTYLRIEIVRVACPVCGVRVERLGFLHSNPRYSRRFAYQVARLCLAMPVSSAAAVAAISWDAARGLLESVSAAALKPLEPPEDLRWIGVDEKSWRRGRRFCTVVSDLESGRVIWLAPGHSGEALAEFFAWLGERRSERIEAAAIDLSHSYEETIRRHCPGVAIVYDRYHVAKLLLEALNDVRKQVVKAAAAEERPLLTNKKWLLLRHERGLDQDGAPRARGAARPQRAASDRAPAQGGVPASL